MELAIAIAANIVIGVVLLALFAWHRAPGVVRLGDSDKALTLYRRHFPAATGDATVAADGLNALIFLEHDSRIGLVDRHGRRWNVRELTPGDLRSVAADGDVITLSFADFGWPKSRIRIADPATRAVWLARLEKAHA